MESTLSTLSCKERATDDNIRQSLWNNGASACSDEKEQAWLECVLGYRLIAVSVDAVTWLFFLVDVGRPASCIVVGG